MKYRIGEVAELFGLTKGGVRYLENRGFIHSKRDEHNNYRYFDRLQITHIKQLRYYQALGFSLEESQELIKFADSNNLMASLLVKEHELVSQVKQITNTINALKTHACKLKLAKEHGNNWIVAKRPAMYRISVWEDLEQEGILDPAVKIERKNAESSFISCIPQISLSILVRRQDEGYLIARGSCIEEADAKRLGIAVNSQVDYYPERFDCYYAIINSRGLNLDLRKIFDKICQMKDNGEMLCGDIIGRVLWSEYKNNDTETHHEIWLPFQRI